MRNTNKTILIPATLFLYLQITKGQEPSFNFGYNILKNKPAFDLLFNRQTPVEASDSYEIKLIKNYFVLNPAAEAHWGTGTDNSANNILLHLNSYYKNLLKKKDNHSWVSLYRINLLSPQFCSDKDFKVYQGLLTAGADYISYYSRRSGLGYLEYDIGANFDWGGSKIDSIPKVVSTVRAKICPSFQWQFWGKKSNDTIPPELDPSFYYKAEFTVLYNQLGYLKQDNRIIKDKFPANVTLQVSYRIVKHMKLCLFYQYGRFEPLYELVNSLSIGIALIN